MLIKIVIVLVVVVIVFLIIVALRPAGFRVERTGTINAPPAAVFAQVNDLHNWEAWSPWAKLDPAAKNSYAGPAAGTGAVFSWAGNSQVGAGSMTITESRPNELVRFKLEFIKPFKGTNIAEFNFRPEGSQTVVIWSMTGRYNFMMKAAGMFMNCEKMMGGFFEKGLAQMKSVTEAAIKNNKT